MKLIRAEGLPAKDFSGTSDPYVKIMLLPDRKHQLVSNIKRKSLNPRWNEIFAFEGYIMSVCSCNHFEHRNQQQKLAVLYLMMMCVFSNVNYCINF